jgi:Co/Zn/Cd efflux system component
MHEDNAPHAHDHDHAHGTIDPTLLTSERGIWALKWSLWGLLATALFQLVVVQISNSVALLADTIHNFGEAAVAIPLWIAFLLVRKKLLAILISGIIVGYQSLTRLFMPQSIDRGKGLRIVRELTA